MRSRRRSGQTTKNELPITPIDAAPPEGSMRGRVIRAYGLFFDVRLQDEPRTLLSTVRGSVKRERRGTDLVAVGDWVWVRDIGEGDGQIDLIEPRVRALGRLARNTKDVEQVIVANLDQVIFVFSWRDPEPHRRMLDRFLVLAESREIPPVIVINKIDLDPEGDLGSRAFFADYLPLYPMHFVSVESGSGIEELRGVMTGKVSAIAGPSGVGKSTLLNRLDPDAVRQTGEISGATGKGRHTTTAAIIYEIAPGTFVADTPGIRALALQGVPPEMLPECYREFRPFLGECFYADCTHIHEPGCAVLSARDAGDISLERWESYASLRSGKTDD
ncbi:ribosome small subunit-dependent GTPase A [soil metagenome]